jgi:hypothetical protein
MTSMSRQPVRRRARVLAAATVAALTCCLSSAVAQAASAGIGPSARATAATFAGFLNDATCVTAADCWAFGRTSGQHAVAEHWNGSAWTRIAVASPRRAKFTYLPSVTCVSGTDCWAVGQYQPPAGDIVAYAEHWDGATWKPVAVRVPAGSVISGLLSVSCGGTASCWAVGTAIPPFLEHWNGHTWTDVTSTRLGAGATPERVACASATDCWLSGLRSNGSQGAGTLIGHWTGGAWTAVRTPTSGISADSLLGISCRATACMAVGSHGDGTLAQRRNDSAWAVTPTGTVQAALYAVSCVSPGSCMAVGGTDEGNGKVFTERWIGARWHVQQAPSPTGAENSSLVGIACVSKADCWGVGAYLVAAGSRSLIEHWNGRAWSIVK